MFGPVGEKLRHLMTWNASAIFFFFFFFEWNKGFKAKRERVKDDSWSGSLSISRTEGNVIQVTQVVSSLVRKIASQLAMKKDSV